MGSPRIMQAALEQVAGEVSVLARCALTMARDISLDARIVTGLRAEHAVFASSLKNRPSPVPVSDAVRDLKIRRQIYARTGGTNRDRALLY
jgi:hypothetical protein